MDDVDYEWDNTFRPLIRTVVQDLMDKKQISLSVEQTMDGYTKCFNLLAKKKLDVDIYERFAFHQDSMIKEIVDQFRFDDLRGFIFYWNVFTIVIKWFKMFFYYLYRLQKAQFPFHTYFCNRYLDAHCRVIFSNMLDIYQGRCRSEYPVCAEIIDCFRQLDKSYVSDLETILLEKNASFYRQQYSIMLNESEKNVHTYVENVRCFMEIESDALHSFHMEDLWERIQSNIITNFIDTQSAWVLFDASDGFAATFRSRHIQRIKNQYYFLHFGHQLELYTLYGKIMDEVMTSLDMTSCVRDVIRLKTEEIRFIDEVFDDQHFHTVLRESIRKYVNSSGYMDHFIRYIDKILRDGTKVDWTDVFDIFELIADKDVFSQTYRELMTYRLLDRYDEDEEIIVLKQMEVKTGMSYIFPMQTMLNEMKLNKMHSFVSKLTNVTVISALQWSVRSDHLYDVRYPSEIAIDMEIFNRSYFERYGQNKKLTYAPHLGRVEIRAIFSSDRIYNLIMTPIQAIVLLALTDNPQTVEEIEQAVLRQTGHIMMVSLLMSLKDLAIRQEDNTWVINTAFAQKKRVLRLPIPNLKKKIVKNDDSMISVQRGYIMDCLIVRIMKANRVMQHNDLVVEVTKHVKTFKPDVRMIKRQIENLIERDYIERDQSSYKYIL